MKNRCRRAKDGKRKGNSLMQCLQTQQLDLIPLSPKLPGFNTHFGAAFCHVHNQLGIWGDWESEDIAQHCWIFRFPSELPLSLPEHFRRHIPWCNTKAKQTWCFSPVLPGLDEEQVSFPNSHHLLQHKLRWHLHWLHNHPSRDTKHPREPRLLHIELFFSFGFCSSELEDGANLFSSMLPRWGRMRVCTKEALCLITHPLNHPCPLACPTSPGNECVSTHVAAMCWDDGCLPKTLGGGSQERHSPCTARG